MTVAVILISALLAGVAAAGVLRPFGARRAVPRLEPQADPLEDERAGLLRALRDLDEDRARGALSDDDHRALRTDTERRAVSVLRALEARDGAGTLGADLQELRPATAEPRPARSPRARAVAVGVGLALAAVTAVALTNAVRSRDAGSGITGSSQDPLAFFEQRVRDHPNDVAARLDLASRYLDAGNVPGAVAQDLAALRLDPTNAEAHADLGWVLYQAGKPDDALRAEQQALQADPQYAEAMYFQGVILLRGLDRPADAAVAFRAYLAAAPFGSHVDEVQQFLAQAAATSPSP
jgi:tetratricopeptide (TPR) repeat protein